MLVRLEIVASIKLKKNNTGPEYSIGWNQIPPPPPPPQHKHNNLRHFMGVCLLLMTPPFPGAFMEIMGIFYGVRGHTWV
jgi:hypothetical protein